LERRFLEIVRSLFEKIGGVHLDRQVEIMKYMVGRINGLEFDNTNRVRIPLLRMFSLFNVFLCKDFEENIRFLFDNRVFTAVTLTGFA